MLLCGTKKRWARCLISRDAVSKLGLSSNAGSNRRSYRDCLFSYGFFFSLFTARTYGTVEIRLTCPILESTLNTSNQPTPPSYQTGHLKRVRVTGGDPHQAGLSQATDDGSSRYMAEGPRMECMDCLALHAGAVDTLTVCGINTG